MIIIDEHNMFIVQATGQSNLAKTQKRKTQLKIDRDKDAFK
jgi:hypothetical protein